ncbi:MAG: phosphatidylglycerophosphatase A [Chitinophagaceae bacterium]|nr:phosphatidylglycerophosphatase A [Chitinophagaceae bacterium]
MIKFHKLVATAGGIGYIGKGGGTVAAIVCCLIWLIIPAGQHSDYRQVFFTIMVCLAGIWSSNSVHSIWGKDSSKVVIDEVAGMMITLALIPVSIPNVVAGLILFRFFDIVKPLFIRRLEQWPKGWGVMADDVLAGFYAHVVLTILVKLNVF